jgi:N-acetylglutamate synthase-like GNAT family acetyltransferase
MIVRDRSEDDLPWIAELLRERWGDTIVVVHGEAIDAMTLPALIAGARQGLATYRVRDQEAELVTLDAVTPRREIGTELLNALVERLTEQGVRRLSVTTTNDNLAALAFYQRRGFRFRRLRPGAVEDARRLKPAIPLLGENGIPIRDEIDLCRDL